MADRHTHKAPGPGAHPPPPFDRKRFESTAEFANFKAGVKKLLAVPKSELDEMVRKAKETSPRVGNPKTAGRKRSRPT